MHQAVTLFCRGSKYSTWGFRRLKCVLQLEPQAPFSTEVKLARPGHILLPILVLPWVLVTASLKGAFSSLHTGKGPSESMLLKSGVPGLTASGWSVGCAGS